MSTEEAVVLVSGAYSLVLSIPTGSLGSEAQRRFSDPRCLQIQELHAKQVLNS